MGWSKTLEYGVMFSKSKKQLTRKTPTWRSKHLGPNKGLSKSEKDPRKTNSNSLQKGRAVVEATYV